MQVYVERLGCMSLQTAHPDSIDSKLSSSPLLRETWEVVYSLSNSTQGLHINIDPFAP